MRWCCVIAFVLVAALLSACGGDSKPSPPGSPDNPLVAQPTPEGSPSGRSNEGSAAPKATEEPGYQSLVERQGRKPRSRFTPCNLVTKAQAQAIVGAPIRDPLEAPKGPTCIYRTQDGKSFITVAVQSLDFSELKRNIHKRQQVNVSDRSAFCGDARRPGRLRLAPEAPRPQRCRALQGGPAVRDHGSRATHELTPGHRRVPGLQLGDAAAGTPAAPGARALGARCPAHGRPARAHQPVHRHLLRDGVDGPAALPRLRRRLHAAGLRRHRRPVQGRGGPGRARQRLHRRPLAAPQGGRGARATACRPSASSLLATVGTALSAIGATVLHRPHGQGHPNGAARRDDLARRRPSASSATAFGVHRALDTTGAMIGPLLAFGLLAVAPLAFDSIFLVSFCIALVGVGDPRALRPAEGRARRGAGAVARRAPSLRSAAALLAVPRYRALLIAGGALSLATASDAFVFLALQRQARPRHLAVPAAVRRQRRDVHAARRARWAGSPTASVAAGCCSAAMRCCSPSTRRCCCPRAAGCCWSSTLGLLGAYYAATDGVLMALGSTVVPEEVRGSGLALVGTVDERRPPGRLGRLRRAVDAVGHPHRDRVLRRRARGGAALGGDRCSSARGSRRILRSRRGALFGVLVVACVLAAVVAIVAGIRGRDAGGPVSAAARDALPAARRRQAADGRLPQPRAPRPGRQSAPLARPAAAPTRTRAALRPRRTSPAAAGICLVRGGGFAAGVPG